MLMASSSDRGRGVPHQSLYSGVPQQSLYSGVPHGVPQHQAGSLMPESAACEEKKPHPFFKIVRHTSTGEVEIRRYWEIPCRNGCDCRGAESGKCVFQHYPSAKDWDVIGGCHTKEAADKSAQDARSYWPCD